MNMDISRETAPKYRLLKKERDGKKLRKGKQTPKTRKKRLQGTYKTSRQAQINLIRKSQKLHQSLFQMMRSHRRPTIQLEKTQLLQALKEIKQKINLAVKR